jgi:16S rRNA (cytosine1402-N4)-methyltransferase
VSADRPHNPVMLDETLELLDIPEGGVCVDCTFGYGGHSSVLCAAVGERGTVIGIDRDPDALAFGREHVAPLHPNLRLVHANFAEMEVRVRGLGFEAVDGVLMDLGVSSPQLDPERARGFSFDDEQILDMRMDPTRGMGAGEFLSMTTEAELSGILHRYGDERHARRIARAVLEAHRRRPLESTAELAEVIRRAAPRRGHDRIDPATRSLLALRIAINDELGSLRAGLWSAFRLLRPHRAVVVLSYHSGEDRIVKQFLAAAVRGCICPADVPMCVCGRKPWAAYRVRRAMQPSDAEVAENPRARSCRLRAAERIGEVPDHEGS